MDASMKNSPAPVANPAPKPLSLSEGVTIEPKNAEFGSGVAALVPERAKRDEELDHRWADASLHIGVGVND